MDDVKLLSVTGLRGGPRQSDKAARRGKPLTVWTGQQKQKKPLPALPQDDHEERDRAGDDDVDRVKALALQSIAKGGLPAVDAKTKTKFYALMMRLNKPGGEDEEPAVSPVPGSPKKAPKKTKKTSPKSASGSERSSPPAQAARTKPNQRPASVATSSPSKSSQQQQSHGRSTLAATVADNQQRPAFQPVKGLGLGRLKIASQSHATNDRSPSNYCDPLSSTFSHPKSGGELSTNSMSAFPPEFDTWTADRKASELELRKAQVQAQAQVQIQDSKDHTARVLAECQIELERLRQSRSIEYCKCFVPPVCLSRLDSLTHLLSHSSRSPLPHRTPHQHVYFLSFALFWDSSRRSHQATLPRSCRQRRRVHH